MRAALRKFRAWFVSRPVTAFIIVAAITHDGLHMSWLYSAVLAFLAYDFVQDGDRPKRRDINIQVNATDVDAAQVLRAIAKTKRLRGES
jgi:hypothetical protein